MGLSDEQIVNEDVDEENKKGFMKDLLLEDYKYLTESF